MKKNENFNKILYEALQKQKTQTNADRIRAMTNDQLVKLFTAFEYDGKPIFSCPADGPNCSMENECRECFLSWLKQEADHGL